MIKIERPVEGDPTRRMGPFPKDEPHPEKSGLFLHLNTNKKGITLNLKSERGKRIFEKLVEDADIVVESFRPSVLPSLGLDYETLKKINPKMVMTSVTSFGQTGPYSDFKTTEIVMYAMAGPMYVTGLPGREPLDFPGNCILYYTGLQATVATMIALWGAREQGEGDHVDASVNEGYLNATDRMGSYMIASQYCRGEVPRRDDASGLPMWPSQGYPCKDGYWELSGIGILWPGVGKMMDMPELIDDPRFNNILVQMQPGHKDQFEAIFLPWCYDHTKMECVKLGQDAGILCGPLFNMDEVINDPHFKERGCWTEIDHPETGKLKYFGRPINAEDMPWIIRRPAPLLGEHNEEIYSKKLGYAKEDLVKLKEAGII